MPTESHPDDSDASWRHLRKSPCKQKACRLEQSVKNGKLSFPFVCSPFPARYHHREEHGEEENSEDYRQAD